MPRNKYCHTDRRIYVVHDDMKKRPENKMGAWKFKMVAKFKKKRKKKG